MDNIRYRAFISYSHRDLQWGAWLQRALERYRIPSRLVGGEGSFGPIPRRLAPVFRDREDLSSAPDLSARVKEALQASEALVVVCSPAAAASAWVSEEINYFQQLGRADRVFALIVDGDPQSSDPAQQCFPPPLLANPDGTPREPLAADVRKWADGKLLAKLKIIAGILGVRLDDLRRRDMQRRQRLWLVSMGGALTVAVAMAILAVMAITARDAAENRREHAEELVGYMVGDLKSKLDEVGRLDILEGVGGRVSKYLQTLDPAEVTDESLTQQARVWRQLGEVSMEQADLSAALEAFTASRDMLLELHRRNPRDAQLVYELGNAEFWVGYVYLETGKFDQAEQALNDYLAWAYRLNELEPGTPEWLIEKSYAHSNLAALINRRGDGEVEAALLHIQRAVEFNRQVIELAPDNAAYLGEYGAVIAWLADTQLLTCDLGGALISRQENVDIAQKLVEHAPGNYGNLERYAYALTGLASVAEQVGMAEFALEKLIEARDVLGQLSRKDPSNLDLRYEYLLRDFYIADLLAETDRLPEAMARMQDIEAGLGEIVVGENYTHRERHAKWARYLLARSRMARRSGNPSAAAADLSSSLDQLERLLKDDASPLPIMNTLVEARFEAWLQRDQDLFVENRFAGIGVGYLEESKTCASQANRVKQAIITQDKETARRITASLLESGYYEPGFIRVCRQYGLCQGAG